MLIYIMWWYRACTMRQVLLHMLSTENRFHKRIIETLDLRQSFVNDKSEKFRLYRISIKIC